MPATLLARSLKTNLRVSTYMTTSFDHPNLLLNVVVAHTKFVPTIGTDNFIILIRTACESRLCCWRWLVLRSLRSRRFHLTHRKSYSQVIHIDPHVSVVDLRCLVHEVWVAIRWHIANSTEHAPDDAICASDA